LEIGREKAQKAQRGKPQLKELNHGWTLINTDKGRRRRSQTAATETIPISLFIVMALFKHGFEKGVSVRYGRFFWRKTGFLPGLKRCEYES
jgi:hypothetical protein